MRNIDRSKPLSAEDALYLSQRGLLTATEEAEFGIVPEQVQINSGSGAPSVAPAEPSPDTADVPYVERSKGDLKAEALSRGLSGSGTIAVLADRLAADDEAAAEAESEEASGDADDQEDEA